MRFELTDEQRMVQESVRRFAESVVAPRAYHADKHGALAPEAITGLAELGLWGARLGAETGGAELPLTTTALALEEIGRRDGSLALLAASHNLEVVAHLARLGGAAAKARWLSRLGAGELLGAFAFAEAGDPSPEAFGTTAQADGEAVILEGAKVAVVGGAAAGLFVVFAREEERGGLSAFLVDATAPGVSVSPLDGLLGMRAAGLARLELSGVRVSAEARLGTPGEALAEAQAAFDEAKLGRAAVAVGLGRGALEEARRYAQERKQFGKPIADFQAIQWMLADIATELDGARLLVYAAADLADRGMPFAGAAAKAKVFATEAAVRAAAKAVQIFGGNGFIREIPVERHLRDARLLAVDAGPQALERVVIARDLYAV